MKLFLTVRGAKRLIKAGKAEITRTTQVFDGISYWVVNRLGNGSYNGNHQLVNLIDWNRS